MPAPPSQRLSLLTFDSRGRLRYWPDAVLVVGEGGRIAAAGPAPRRMPPGTRDRRGLLAVPGLVDSHVHLPQLPAAGLEGGELLAWLRLRIFPLERGFRGEPARALARAFFAALAAHGTTCAAVYTSIWRDSAEACFEEALRSGLRAVMGKVMMDRLSYDGAMAAARRGEDRTALSLRESEELCRRWHGAGGGRLGYAFTPRFALSCSMELMRGAARLARLHGAFLQTHLSENREEAAAVRRAFPGRPGYARVYDRAGLLGPRTILAHSIWLSPDEVSLLASRGCAVAHCPTSNAFLASGIMDLGGLRRAGIRSGLGSDVAGGPTLDLFEVMRQAVYAQRLAAAHRLFGPAGGALSAEGAFRLATRGGAEALGLSSRIGTLEAGKEADFVILDPAAYRAPGAPAPRTARDAVSELVYRGGRAAVAETWVAGRRVYSRYSAVKPSL